MGFIVRLAKRTPPKKKKNLEKKTKQPRSASEEDVAMGSRAGVLAAVDPPVWAERTVPLC